MAASRRVRRYALGGALIGLALGAIWARLQYGADARGVRAVGIAEGWFLTGLPGSLVLPFVAYVAPRGGWPGAGGPRLVLYVLIVAGPTINWAVLGALWGWLCDRDEAFRASRPEA